MYGSKRRAPPKRILGSALMDHSYEFADGTPASVSTIGFTPMPLYIYSAFTSKCEVILKPAPALAFHPLLRRSLTCPTKGVNPAPTLNVYQCSLASCACPRPARPSANTAVTTNRNFPIPILSSTPSNSLTLRFRVPETTQSIRTSNIWKGPEASLPFNVTQKCMRKNRRRAVKTCCLPCIWSQEFQHYSSPHVFAG